MYTIPVAIDREIDSHLQVNSYAKLAWGVLSLIPKVNLLPRLTRGMLILRWQAFLKQAERDGNIQTLLVAIHDAFDFAQPEDVLKSIKAGSKQAHIVIEMLKEVQSCGEFIQRYANDPQLCMTPSPPFLSTIIYL